jgi:mRNA interferase RelE/StbE
MSSRPGSNNRSTKSPPGCVRACGGPDFSVSCAQQIYYSGFDEVFLDLPAEVRRHIEARLDDMSRRLASYPHYRMSGSDRYRLRVGDYRVIYRFDTAKGEIHLLAVGHRREIYK